MLNNKIFALKPLYNINVSGYKAVIEVTGYTIVKRTLFDHVMRSSIRMPTPYGYIPRLHLSEQDGMYSVRSWTGEGFTTETLSTHQNRHDAEAAMFQLVYENEFMEDDSPETYFFETPDEAGAAITRIMSDTWNVDEETAHSILQKQKMVAFSRSPQIQSYIEGYREKIDSSLELAADYLNLIPPAMEKYNETCSRIIQALDEPVPPKTLHAIAFALRYTWRKEAQQTRTHT